MEYGRLKPIEGVNGYEKTAVTLGTIKDIIEEEAKAAAQETERRKARAEAQAGAENATPAAGPATAEAGPDGLMLPPHMGAPAAAAEAQWPETPAVEHPSQPGKSRSLWRRLVGG